MIGIEAIACEIPEHRISNLERAQQFGTSVPFLREKIGVVEIARKRVEHETSDLCVAAAQRLFNSDVVTPDDVDCAAVVTQNPDGHGLPHVAAIVHGKLGLSERCATFDISLGCSGYVQALSMVSAFMAANGMRRGLLFTADPYSKVIDDSDRDTALLFGDAATVTLLSAEPAWRLGRFDFGTRGEMSEALSVNEFGKLCMNGRTVFTFSATSVPPSIARTLERNGLTLADIDRVILHQGSKYIVDTVGQRIGAADKTCFYAANYGNTVSSSIPIILSQELAESDRRVLISGFGVGLSWATTILERTGPC